MTNKGLTWGLDGGLVFSAHLLALCLTLVPHLAADRCQAAGQGREQEPHGLTMCTHSRRATRCVPRNCFYFEF